MEKKSVSSVKYVDIESMQGVIGEKWGTKMGWLIVVSTQGESMENWTGNHKIDILSKIKKLLIV